MNQEYETELTALRTAQDFQMSVERVIAKLVGTEPKITTIANVLDGQTPEIRAEIFKQFSENRLLKELFPTHVEMMGLITKLYEESVQ